MKPEIESFAVIGDAHIGIFGDTIKGIKVAQTGPLNAGDVRNRLMLDMDTLAQIVELGNRPNKGVKSRYTHPDEDPLGLHLGRWSNFRIDGDCVRADLRIADSSRKSPKGDIGGYVLSLASEDAESIGASIAVIKDQELMQESVRDGMFPLRIAELYSVDIVGSPAATRGGLFSMEPQMADEETKEPPVEETKEENQYAFLSEDSMSPEDKVRKVAEMLGYEFPMKEEDKKEEMSLGTPERYLETFGDKGARWYLEKKPFESCVVEAWQAEKARVEELSVKLESMQAKVDAADSLRGVDEPLSRSVGERQELRDQKEVLALKRKEKFDELRKQGVSEADARFVSGFAILK